MPARNSAIEVSILSRDLVLDLLDGSFEANSVLFVSEFGKVVIDEQREAEPQQEDQVGQEHATRVIVKACPWIDLTRAWITRNGRA